MSNSIKMESLIQPRPGRGNPSVPNPSMIEEPIDAIYLQPQNNPSHIEVAGDGVPDVVFDGGLPVGGFL